MPRVGLCAPPDRALSSPIMSATLDTTGPADPPLADVSFERVLLPHRSLPPHGFRLLMGLLGVISIAVGIGFVSIGPLPVCGFFWLDVALLYLAFRLNYRSARQCETLRLADDQFTVERVGVYGARRLWRCSALLLRRLVPARAAASTPV